MYSKENYTSIFLKMINFDKINNISDIHNLNICVQMTVIFANTIVINLNLGFKILQKTFPNQSPINPFVGGPNKTYVPDVPSLVV